MSGFESAIFESEAGRDQVRGWHRHFRERITAPLESRTLPTTVGETHVLVGGPVDAPPVVLLHGAMASSSQVLHELADLMAGHRVYAVDVIGQSVMSADVRLPVDDDSYGRWLVEVLEGLDLEAAHVVGVSWGGFVAQRLAILAPERVRKLVLLVPAGIVSGPMWAGFWKLGWPMMMYRKFPSEARRAKLFRHLLTTPDDPSWVPFLGDAFLAYRLDMRIPAVTKDGELDALAAPTLVLGAGADLSFPGAKMLRRVRELLPNAEVELLEGHRHCPATTDEFREWLARRIGGFRAETAEEVRPMARPVQPALR